MKLKPVGEQVVVVMGASSGIGRETALRLAKRGAKMVVAARSEAGLRSLEDDLRTRGARAHLVCGGETLGIDGFLESLRVELLPGGWNSISVTNVMPAVINTPFFTKVRTKLGVKPKGFPPIYQPGVVADAILYSAEKAPREIVAGGASEGLLLTQRVSPRLMDALMVRGGFGSQMTDEPKSSADPEALSRL